MKSSETTIDDDIGDIRPRQIIELWSEEKSPKQIADELTLPIQHVYRILKDVQRKFIKKKLQ
jgi:hypothetical protein